MFCPDSGEDAPVVLIVDDDLTARIIAREHLESAGFVVHEAVDGREAIESFASLKPDAVLMDVVMPHMDGISACAEIRRLPGAETVPILILTGHDDIREIERAYAAGATDFTSKPVEWMVELHRLQYMLRAAKVIEELREREAELRHSQKMEAVGRLAGGVAHDFNNMLTAITAYGDFAADQLASDHPAREDLREVRKAAERATTLTRQLLAFSRREVPDPEPVCLNTVVTEMEGMLQRLIGEAIVLTVNLDPEVATIEANRNQVEQVIMNLVVNAGDALRAAGVISIGTADVELDAVEAQQRGDISAGRYAVLTVRDTGEGIDPAIQKRIFEPFFTTKEAGKGTGLGLSTVYGIVQSVGGTVTLDSQPGRGACFGAYFPTASQPVGERRESVSKDREQVAGTETVLVVEDEESVRAVMLRALTGKGYDVLEARDGKEALDLARSCERHIDLVVSDLYMPRLGGRELAERLRSVRNGFKLMLTSGHFSLPDGEDSGIDGATHLLEKPFTPAVFLRAVREALDRK